MKEIQTRQEFNFVRTEAHSQRNQVAEVMAKVNWASMLAYYGADCLHCSTQFGEKIKVSLKMEMI